jgi:hypothetical protein
MRSFEEWLKAIEIEPTYLERTPMEIAYNAGLREGKEPVADVLCNVGLDGLAHLKNYAKTEQGRAEAYAKEANRTGDTSQAIAWNHTVMAYADIICEIEKAD